VLRWLLVPLQTGGAAQARRGTEKHPQNSSDFRGSAKFIQFVVE